MQKAEKIKEITPELKKLAEDMMETMLRAEPEGVGLAAPQVGVSQRLFVAQTEQGPCVFINPKLKKKGRASEIMEEGCLSLPGVWLKVKRTKKVEVKALDISGKKIKTRTEGLYARILQHEMDHLNGILIRDKEVL